MTSTIDQLSQLAGGPVWDGNLIGKSDRDRLKQGGFADQISGFNFLTSRGVALCVTLGLLTDKGPTSSTEAADVALRREDLRVDDDIVVMTEPMQIKDEE